MKKLRPLKKARKPKDFAVIDTETWGLGGELAFGIVYLTDKKYWIFYTKKEFYEILAKQRIKNVYAHNLDFDAIKIRDKSSVENTTNVIYAGGSLLKFTDEKNINWFDSYCLLKSSVSNLGQALGYKKLDTPDKFINPSTKTKNINQTDIKYCKRDCKIVMEFLKIAFNIIGTQKLTIASASMFIFRKQFLKQELVISELHSNFKDSYYGGRVEAFYLGKVNAKVVDINSLYPYVMRITPLPHPSFLKETSNLDLQEFTTILNRFEGCAEVVIYHPKTKIGLIPYRHNGKLIFPYGLIEGTYNFNELRFAVSQGCVLKQVKKVTYSKVKLFNFFTPFVEHFYNLKNTSKGAEKLFYKFILNSLYGKFGERKHNERIYLEAKELNENVRQLEKSNDKYKVVQVKRNYYYIDIERVKKDPPIHQVYTICSYITSAARLELTKELVKNSEAVLYCDTDSIALSTDFKGKLSTRLGDWSFESYEISKIYGNKYYKTNNGLKIKGVPKRATIDKRSFNYEHLIKTKESIRRGLKAGSTVQMSKKIKFDYDKRKPTKNGFTKIINTKNLI